MSRWKASRALGLALGVTLLAGGAALAQQPGQPPPGQPGNPAQPGQPIQILPRQMPGARPGQPGQPGQPGRPIIGPDGKPIPMPPGGRALPPGARPGTPGMPGARPGPGGRPLPPGFNPRRPAAAPEPEETKHAEECPGHGHDDPPPAPNWWRGILMVDNERAESPSFINKLFFRYENHKDPCDPKNQPPPVLASVLNFGLLAWVLYRYGRKPLAEALLKRKQSIMAEIDTATKLKEDAEARLHDYEDKLERLEETLAELRAEYAAQSADEKKHVLAEAEERRARMRRDAEFRIEQESKAARARLLDEAVAGAVTAAEELLAKRVSSNDLDRLADDYLASVGSAVAQRPKTGATARGGDA